MAADQGAGPGGDIANYELLRFIERGGFGAVWLARERVTDLPRAVKLLPKESVRRSARDLEGVKRYQRCAHAHPHLLQILLVGENDECFYYVMEAADAWTEQGPKPLTGVPAQYGPTTLRRQMEARGWYPAREALNVTAKLLAGVARLHEQGLAHFDLKPENVLVVHGEPKLGDVGLVAGRDDPAPKSGTPQYLTPEGTANDVFALGRILYELITGLPPGEFPRLPVELLRGASRELRAAVAIANRACHPDPDRRFGDVDELQRAVEEVLHPPRSLGARWRGLRPRVRWAIRMAVVSVVLAGLAIGRSWQLYAYPQLSRTVAVDWQPPGGLERVGDLPEGAGHNPEYAFLREPSGVVQSAGIYQGPLPAGLQYFAIDYHFRAGRPWGNLLVGFVGDPAAPEPALSMSLAGQPDGEGLRIACDGDDRTSSARDHEYVHLPGHPQPGGEYVVRLATTRAGYRVAVWPLARQDVTPDVLTPAFSSDSFRPTHWRVHCSTVDRHSFVELLGAEVRQFTGPLHSVADFPPEQVTGEVVPFVVPDLPPEAAPPSGNLLAGPFHPYDSDAWTSVGNWSWWSGAAPGATPKAIRCVPWSTVNREDIRTPALYTGLQMLRFDRAVYGDFEARLRLRFADPSQPGARSYDPFTSPSHAGKVGLAIRLQDEAVPGEVLGGMYVACLRVDPGGRRCGMSVDRVSGLAISGHNTFAVGAVEGIFLASADDCLPWRALFDPRGVVLTVRAEGRRIRLYLNDGAEPIVVADDHGPAPFDEGRVALFTQGLIAVFDSLEIKPLPGAGFGDQP